MRTSTSARWLAPAVLLLAVAPALAACGDGDDDAAAGPSSEASSSETVPTPTASATEQPSTGASTSPTTSSSQPPAAKDLPDPCDLVSAADVSDAYSETFKPDGGNSDTTVQEGVEWRSKGCEFEADDRAEVEVALTGRDDFTKGSFQCLPLSDKTGIVSPADVAGTTSAWWKTNEAPPLEATLRACTDEVIVQIEIEYDDGVNYEGDPQNGSIQLAEKVLGGL